MAKNSIRDFDATSSNNTDIQSVDISEGCSPAGINNAIRELMTDLKNVSAGTIALESPSADSMTVTGDLTISDKIVHSGDTNTAIRFAAADTVTIETAGSERVRVDSNGQLGIGVTSVDTALHVKSANDTVAIIESSDATAKLQIKDSDSTHGASLSVTNETLNIQVNGGTRATIDSSGHITSLPTYNNGSASSANVVVNSSGLFLRSVSARKYKADIEDVEASYAEALYGLRPVYYRSTLDADNSDHSHWGFIAEEVAAIDPRLVHYATHEVTYDDDGAAVETELDTPVAEGVQYERFVPLLLKLITDQKDRIEDLETKVADFETRLTALEAE